MEEGVPGWEKSRKNRESIGTKQAKLLILLQVIIS
jgi:hypothetical protein